MIPIKQRQLGLDQAEVTKENVHLSGDCTKCAVASILEREYDEVPHFAYLSATSNFHWTKFLNDWLIKEGYPFQYREWYINAPEGQVRYPGWWIGLVKSKTLPFSNHAIVMQDSFFRFDPSVNADKPEYQAKPYEFIGIGYFSVPFPAQVFRDLHAYMNIGATE